MKRPGVGKITWLIKSLDNHKITLGFLRDKFDGCFIIGGTTGSHYTGHDEKWKTKWLHYIKQGYIDVEKAKKLNILPRKWHAPKISLKDKKMIKTIKSQWSNLVESRRTVSS